MNNSLTPEQQEQLRSLIDELLTAKSRPLSVQIQMPSQKDSLLTVLTNAIPVVSTGFLGTITNGLTLFLGGLTNIFTRLVEILGPQAASQLLPGLVNVIYKEVPIEQMKGASQEQSKNE